jgi:hypothetical protein
MDGHAIDENDAFDFRGSARLTGAAEWFWYGFAGITYIVAGIWHKWILNWIIGPVWLIAVVCIGPPLLARLRNLRGRQ